MIKNKNPEKNFKMTAFWIGILLTLIYIAQMLFPNLTYKLILNKNAYKRPYLLITSMFIHYNFAHLVQNVTALLIFGLLLEGIVGWKNFLEIFIVSGIIGNICMLLYNPNVYGLGSSGGIMGIIGALTYLRPWMPIYFIAPIPVVALGIMYFLIDFLGLLHPTDNIGYAAHIGGFITGVLWAYIYKKKYEKDQEKEIKEEDKFVNIEDEE